MSQYKERRIYYQDLSVLSVTISAKFRQVIEINILRTTLMLSPALEYYDRIRTISQVLNNLYYYIILKFLTPVVA